MFPLPHLYRSILGLNLLTTVWMLAYGSGLRSEHNHAALAATLAAVGANALRACPAPRWGRLAAVATRLLGLTLAAWGFTVGLGGGIGDPAAVWGPWAFTSNPHAQTVSVTLVVLTGAAVAAAAFRGKRWSRTALATSAVSVWLGLGLLLAEVFRLVTLHVPWPSLCIALCVLQLILVNLVVLTTVETSAPLASLLTGDDLGAIVARKLMVRGGLYLLACGFMRIYVQQVAYLTTAEGTALFATLSFLFFIVTAHQYAQAIRSDLNVRRRAHEALASAIQERDAALTVVRTERNMLQALLRGSHHYGVIATNAEGIITLFNEGAEQMLGYTAQQVVGEKNLVALHDDKELVERARMLGTQPNFDVIRLLTDARSNEIREWTYRRADGKAMPTQLSVAALHNEQGDVHGYVGIVRDLSQDKKMQRDRDGFFEVGQELLCVAQLPNRLVMANPAFDKVFGCPNATYTGQSFLHLVHPDDREITEQALAQIGSGERLQRFENRWRCHDRRYRWISWACTVPDQEGLFYASGWDVTQEKQRDQERQRHLEFEQQLIGIVSHDLRNPIAAISLSAETLLRKAELKAQARPLQRIADSAKRAERMVHDLLDFTQARLGHGLQVAPCPVDLTATVRRCLDDIQLMHPGRSVRLVAEEGLWAMADEDRVAQLLTNLLSNGLKYSPADSAVTVTLRHEAPYLTLEVHNEGEPIPAAYLPHLFEPLRRGTQTGRAQRNVGLGLYIVKEIVYAHGGFVDVASDLLSGTTFKVALPARTQSARGEQGSGF